MTMTRIGTPADRPYSLAIAAEGKFVFVSGQIPLRGGEMVTGPIGEQTTAYVAAFGSTLPARSTVGVTLPGYGVEIDCIAVIA